MGREGAGLNYAGSGRARLIRFAVLSTRRDEIRFGDTGRENTASIYLVSALWRPASGLVLSTMRSRGALVPT